MKHWKSLLLATLLVPGIALAVPSEPFVRNDAASSTVNGQNGGPGKAAVSSTGRLFISGTIDAGATSIAHVEDTVANSGDTLLGIGGYTNEAGNVLAASDGDWTYPGLTRKGEILVVPNYSSGVSDTIRTTTREDDAIAGASAGIKPLFQRQDVFTVDQTDLDAALFKGDKYGRLYVAPAPQASLFSCVSSADVTDTSAATLCAADADEIFVVLDACCLNTDTAVGTIVHLQDETGPTVFHDFFLPPYVAAAPGDSNECQTFPGGIKMAAVNKAIQILNVTTSAQVRCSIHGFKVPS